MRFIGIMIVISAFSVGAFFGGFWAAAAAVNAASRHQIFSEAMNEVVESLNEAGTTNE